MSEIKLKAAEVLHPALNAFHTVEGETLRSVWYLEEEGNREKIIFCFETSSLVLSADSDDDSVDFWATNDQDLTDGVNVSDSEPWRRFIGKPFGWGWVTINQQGYLDGVLLGFETIVPQLFLNVIASSFKVRVVSEFV